MLKSRDNWLMTRSSSDVTFWSFYVRGTIAVKHNSKSISELHELGCYYEMRMNVSAGIVESIGAASMETLE